MAWILVQQNTGVQNHFSGASQALNAFTAAATLGDIVLVSAWGASDSVAPTVGQFTVTDNVGNTYSPLLFERGNQADAGAYDWVAVFGSVIQYGGTLTPTISINPNSTVSAVASEWSGGSLTIDGSAVVSNVPLSASPLTLSISTSVAKDLLIAVASRTANSSNETGDTVTSPTGFTTFYQYLNSALFGNAGESNYKILPDIVLNQSVAWSDSTRSIYWAGGVVALQPAGPTPAVPNRSGGGGGSGGAENEGQAVHWRSSPHYRWNLGVDGSVRHEGVPQTPALTQSGYRTPPS